MTSKPSFSAIEAAVATTRDTVIGRELFRLGPDAQRLALFVSNVLDALAAQSAPAGWSTAGGPTDEAPSLSQQTRQLAKAYRAAADKAAEAWLVKADPRAVQGGDTCAEADDMRKLAKQLFSIADFAEEAL